MANYNELKAAVNSAVYTNGNEEITASMLNQALQQMIASLGAGYQFMGVATPATNPGTPDYKVFYLAATPGTYTRFGSLVVGSGEICIFKRAAAWTKEVLLTVSSGRPAYDDKDITEDDFTISSGVALLSISDGHLGYIVDIAIPTPDYLPWDGTVNINLDAAASEWGDTVLLISVPSERTAPVRLNGGQGGTKLLYPGRSYRITAAHSSGGWFIIGLESEPAGLTFIELGWDEWQISSGAAELTLSPERINGRLVRLPGFSDPIPNSATVQFSRTPGVNGRCVIEAENSALVRDYSIDPDEGYTDTIDVPTAKSVYLNCEIINGSVWVTGITYYDI